RAVLPLVRAYPSALPFAVHFAGGAGAHLHCAAALSQRLPTALRINGIRRVALLHAGGFNGLHLPPQKPGPASCLQCLGLSVDSSDLPGLRWRTARSKLCRKPERLADRNFIHFVRAARSGLAAQTSVASAPHGRCSLAAVSTLEQLHP